MYTVARTIQRVKKYYLTAKTQTQNTEQKKNSRPYQYELHTSSYEFHISTVY